VRKILIIALTLAFAGPLVADNAPAGNKHSAEKRAAHDQKKADGKAKAAAWKALSPEQKKVKAVELKAERKAKHDAWKALSPEQKKAQHDAFVAAHQASKADRKAARKAAHVAAKAATHGKGKGKKN
jgi:hypothetical protein